MNLRPLEIFVMVAENRGFTAAASKLAMAQPAVSLAIRKLETGLGSRLFERDRSGIRLTQAGTVLLRHAQAMLAHAQNARREIGAFQRLEAGHVVLGAPAMVAGYLLPEPLARFKAEYPGIEVSVVQSGAKSVEESVRAGRVGVGVISDWRTAAGLHVERMKGRRMVACVAKGSPLARRKRLTWDQFMREPLILFPREYYQRQFVDEVFRARGRRPAIVVEAETIPLIVKLISEGVGVGTLLDAAADAYRDQICAIALPAEASVPVALCCRGREELTPAEKALWERLKSRLNA